MAGIKKYDIDGVADKLQLGKHGPRLAASEAGIELLDKDGALVVAKAAPGTANEDVVTVAQLTAAQAAAQAAQAVAAAQTTSALAMANMQINTLQTMLNKLMPVAPPKFPAQPLTIKGAPALLAAGNVPNTSGQAIAPGAAVTRVAGALISNTIKASGPGDAGTLSLLVDGTTVETYDFTKLQETVAGSALHVTGVGPYPAATPGFWTSFDAQVKLVQPTTGIHEVSLSHSTAGSTAAVVVVVDDLNSKPVLSNGSVAEYAAGTLAHSSGVPHYGSDAKLNVEFSMSNICGEAYEPNDPVTIAATPDVVTKQAFSYTDLGFAVPLVRQTLSPTAVKPMIVALTAPNYHGLVQITATGANVVGATEVTVSPLLVLVKQGSTGHVDEQAIAVNIRSGLLAKRVIFATETDTPAGEASAFDSTAAVRAVDATVVAAVLSHDKTNYATGHLPVGPDLSVGRDGVQYATFAFSCAALSKFSISVEGSYDHCWIKLPGVAEDATTSPVSAAVNGWWDAFEPYNGAGAPGGEGDTLNGCALGETMNGSSGNFTMTFGSATSSNATDQTVLVRFRLAAGHSISYLAFAN